MKIKDEAQLDEVVKSNSRVVVDFYAEWCGPCKALGKMLEDYPTDTLIVKVDCDVSPNLASRFGVRSIPYMVRFENGTQTESFVGVPNEQKLREFIG